MHETKVTFRYSLELSAALLFYIVILISSIRVGRAMSPGLARTLVEVSPMIPVLLTIWVIVRQFRRIDEYIRLKTLESLAIAAAVTAAWTFTYGFLENAGYPRLSMFSVWIVMGSVWALVSIIRCWTSR
jgi:hypothetical protein